MAQDMVLGTSPPTPTQAMMRMGSLSPSPSSILSGYTFPPNTYTSRKRAFSTTPTIIPSPPRSSRSPSLSFVPQVKKTTKPTSPSQQSRRQNSTSLNPMSSPRNSPPPDFLLDDDPFANLTGFGGGASVSRQLSGRAEVKSPRSRYSRSLEHDAVAIGSGTKTSPSRTTTPTSPSRVAASPSKVVPKTTATALAPTKFPGFGMRSSFSSIDSLTSSTGWSISQPQPPLPSSPPPHQPSPSSPPPQHQPIPHPPPHRLSPAHQRPAFKSRPSLPSLNTLAKMNFIPGAGFGIRKVRKGKVGAGLPFEPWNSLRSPNSSGETSPVLEEEDETETEAALETAGKNVPPFPTLVSVMESASGNVDQDFPPSPPPKDSSSPSSSPTSSPPKVHAHIVADMSPPRAEQTQVSIPEAVVYGYFGSAGSEGGITTDLASPLRSPQTTSAAPQVSPLLIPPPPPPSPPQLMLRSSILQGDETPASTDIVDSASASSVGFDVTHAKNSRLSLEESLDSHHLPNPVLAFRHDDAHVYAGGAGIVDDDSDDDVDQFMDQFMEHYDRVDREEDQRDDASRLGLQDQEGPGQEDVVLVNKRVVVDEDADETVRQLPPRPRSTSPLVVAAAATSVSLFSSETTSGLPTLTVFPDTSSAILAPTLRPRTRIRTMNTPITTSLTLDSEADDSPLLFDSYLYTYPYPSSRQNDDEILERLTSVSTPSVSDSTPPASATWSPSESASVSRSRSFSSTHTTLSFGSESESSGPRSSVGDDETHIQHPPSSQLMKSPMDPVLRAEVSVLGSPPPLSMPFGGNEDISYIVSVPGPFSISPVRHGPLSSDTARHDDTKKTNSTTSTTYFTYNKHDGDNDEDRAGEAAGEGFDARRLWVGGGRSDWKNVEDEVLSQKREDGIMRKKDDLETEVDEDVEAEVGHGVEWEYIVGDNAITGSDGRLDVTRNGHGREGGHGIAIVTPDAEPVVKLATTTPLSTTTLTTPPMTLSTSAVLEQDDLTCGSSTAVAAALAMSTWKQDPSELDESLVSSTRASDAAVVDVNLRTQLSSTPSIGSTPSPSSRFPAVSEERDSRFSESEDESEDEDDEDDNDQKDDDEDDDIPLAKRIPGALTAQKSIRHQVRQEREKKKQEKVLRGRAETTRTRLMTLRPTGAAPSSPSAPQTNQPLEQPRRLRNLTLTGKGSMSFNPFSPEDLVKKLRDINGPDGVESAVTSAPVNGNSLYQQQQRALPRYRSKSMTRSMGDIYGASPTEVLPPPIPQLGSPILHAQRTKSIKDSSSFYHYHTSPSPTPIFPMAISPSPHHHHHHHRSLSRSRNSLERTSMTIPEPVPPIPSARITHDDHHRSFKSHHYESSSSSSRAGPIRISVDADKPLRATSHRHRQVPVPVPALPSPLSPVVPSPVSIASKLDMVVQQRVFISNMQRFNMVEISASTSAGDVIEMIEADGSLKGFAGSGGWMVFEVAQDFGMERPIRSFELVTDVQASWNKDKMVNYLVLRMTPLEVPLNRSAIPSSSPTHSGYVEWEAKRG